MEARKRKPSFFRFLLRFILILLLLVLLAAMGLAMWLGVRMKNTDVVLDDIPALLSAQPMEAGERFFCEDGEHLAVVLDKRDIWWMLDKRCSIFLPSTRKILGPAQRPRPLGLEQHPAAGRRDAGPTG